MKKCKVRLNNSKGFLTIEFTVALLISVAFSIMFFVLAFTLSSSLIAQYVAFAIGHAYSGGHVTEGAQRALAANKCLSILGNRSMCPGSDANPSRPVPAFGRLFSQGWFSLKLESFHSGKNGDVYTEYPGSPDGTKLPSTGIRMIYTTNLFNLKLGPLGSTNPQDEKFSAKVTGFMLRNPTQEECQTFMKVENRHRAIINLDDRYKQYDRQAGSNPEYFPMEDNGC